MKIILICGTGRSGSTTLQRIINTIKDSDITGEKGLVIENILQSYRELIMNPHLNNNSNPGVSYVEKENCFKPCWFNNYNIDNVKDNYRKLITSIISSSDKRVIGFKEIRWFGGDTGESIYKIKDGSLINVFLELFPETKIILHIDDNLERQKNSGWFKNNPDSEKELQILNERIIKFSEINNCYLSYMKDLFNIDKQKEMFKFLEEDFNEELYNYIIENKYE